MTAPQSLVSDTHPLVSYATGKYAKLSKRVKAAFDDAVNGSSVIYVPMPVLWEISLLVKANQIKLRWPLEDYVTDRFYAKAIIPVHMEEPDVIIAHGLNFTKDPFDTMIVAMALRIGFPLITNDSHIHKAEPCDIFW